MSSFTIQSRTARDSCGLTFTIEGDRVIVSLPSTDVQAATIVQAFDATRDVCYRTPSKLSSEELMEELSIHYPDGLQQRIEEKPFGANLDRMVLLQQVDRGGQPLSLLASIRAILQFLGTVNSAVLQADNGCLVFVRIAGGEETVLCSPHSLATFFELGASERGTIFPDFSATEVLLSGSDLDHFEDRHLEFLSTARRIRFSDFEDAVEFSDEARGLVEATPHRYTLAIGAACVLANVRRELLAGT